MRTANVLIICVTVLLLSILLGAYLFTRDVSKVAGQTVAGARDMLDALFGQGKTRFTISHEVVSITPISEVALASQTVRITDIFSRVWMGSECVVVSEQEFVVKWGYDTKDVFTIVEKGEEPVVPEPRILSIEPVTAAPRPLFQANGIWNRLTPEDMRDITNRMAAKVRNDRQTGDFRKTLQEIIRGQLNALRQQMQQPPAVEPK